MSNPDRSRHPPGLYVLFFTEMWERFGFYTLMALLTLYLDEYFHFESKGQIYGGFVAFVYFAPIVGGFIADRVLGFRRTIASGAVLLALGYGVVACPYPENPENEAKVAAVEQVFQAEQDAWQERYDAAKEKGIAFEEKAPQYSGPGRHDGRWLFFLGLAVVVIGNGLFKPNISVLVGNLYTRSSPLKDAAFNIFYMGINIGAFLAPLAAGELRNRYGWSQAFAAAALGMVVSLVIFLSFWRQLGVAETDPSLDREGSVPDLAPGEIRERIKALFTIFAIVILFWLSFYQNGFTLTLWARDSTGPIFGRKISPELFQSVNPFFIVLLTPLIVMFWGALRRRGKEPSTPGKMALGMLMTAFSFAIMAVAGRLGGDTGLVSPLWLVGTYAGITVAEVCLSPMGLSFVSKVAPPRLRGLMMGGWFGATAAGGYLAGAIEPLWDRWSHSTFFSFLVAISLVATALLALRLRFLRRAMP